MTPQFVTVEEMVETAGPVVARVLRARFRASLSASDDSRDNERARDCFQQTMLELIEKFARVVDGDDPPILSVPNYAARAANNCANEVIRPPNWTALANRIRRAISKETSLDTWEHAELGIVAGFVGWRTRDQASGSVANVRAVSGDLRASAVLATRWDRLGWADWAALLEEVFNAAGGPLPVGSVIHLLAELLDVAVEVPWTDDAPESGDSDPAIWQGWVRLPGTDESAIVRQQLHFLWGCVRQLRREWRLAYLLNPPSVSEPQPQRRAGEVGSRPRTSGRSTARGEIEVLPANGVASIEEIGNALELSAEDCRRIREALEASGRATGGADPMTIFDIWTHLPFPDSLIGRLLDRTGMQVLGLRKLALRELKGCMVDCAAPGHKGAPRPSAGQRGPL
jgi:hypothetical protein